MVKQNIEVIYGKGQKRSLLQKYYDKFLEIYMKLMRYEESLAICGDRNSYSNPTDTKTYIPFMKEYKKRYGYYPKWPIGDAGYGSYDNLLFNVINGMELGLKYNYYAKKNTKEFKKKIYNQMNWKYDEKGYKVCPEGHSFHIEKDERWNNAGEYL